LSEIGGLDDIHRVVVGPEEADMLSGDSAQPVRERAPVTLGLRAQEGQHLQHARRTLRARDEAALDADRDAHQAEAAAADGTDIARGTALTDQP
jgi:hypothetical protein